jgi:alpha-1,4-digalacturonate transport system permease protein
MATIDVDRGSVAAEPTLAERQAAAAARRRRRRRLKEAGWFTLALLVAVVMAFPIYWMFATAVSDIADLRQGDYGLLPAQFDLGNFVDAWRSADFTRWFGNSVVIGVVSTALTVTINVIAGYAFAKLRFPGRRILLALIVATLFIPIQVIMVPQFRVVVDLGWLNSLWGVIVPRAAEAFGIFFAVQFFRAIPDEVIEAARIDGASELTILRRVVLPVSKPLIAVLVIFTFMWRWNEFAWPLIILKDNSSFTMPIGILFLNGQNVVNWSALMAMTLVSTLPVIAVFLAFQRYFVEGLVRSGLK